MSLLSRRVRRAALLVSLISAVLLGCESDEPSLLAPLSTVTIRSTLPDGSLLGTEFQVESRVVGRSIFHSRVATDRGIATVSLPPGSYSISDLSNQAYYTSNGPVAEPEAAEMVEITRLQSADIEFRYASLSIRLRSPSGESVAWDDAVGSGPFIIPFGRERLRAEGDSVIVISPLPTGDYKIASGRHGRRWPLTWYPSQPSRSRAIPVRLGAGEARSIEIDLLPPSYVAFDCPAPVPVADWQARHCLRMTVSDFEYADVGYADCVDSAAVIVGPFAPATYEYDLTLSWSHEDGRRTQRSLQERSIDLVEGDTTRVSVPSISGIEVAVDPAVAELILHTEGGQAVARAHGGPALLFAEPGTYRMSGMFLGDGRTYWRRSQRFEGSDSLIIGTGLRKTDWRLVRTGTARGRILGEDGTRAGDILSTRVHLHGPGESRAIFAESDGSFAFSGLWPGEYRILAEPVDDAYRPTWFGDTADSAQAERFTIVEGEHRRDLEIRLVRR